MDMTGKEAAEAYSAGRMSRRELMDRLDTDDFGEVLRLLAQHGLRLPRAPLAGREEAFALALDAARRAAEADRGG